MPSWPSRLLSGSSSLSAPLTAPVNPPRIDNAPIAISPNLEGSSSGASPARRPTRHGRSISHPFPSIFGNGKKLEFDMDTLDDEEEDFGSKNESFNNISRMASRRGVTQQAEKDLVIGRCATCDSTVRWPRHLDVYRCSVCLMVNDLKSDNKLPRKVLPLSLNRTQVLIEQCVDAYLQRWLSHETRREDYGLGNPAVSRQQMTTILQQSPPARPSRAPPLPPSSTDQPVSSPLSSQSNNYPSGTPPLPSLSTGQQLSSTPSPQPNNSEVDHAKYVFKPLENYLIASLHDCICLNSSFRILRPSLPVRAASEGATLRGSSPELSTSVDSTIPLFEVDAKTLLLGDVAENGLWWTGNRIDRHRSQRDGRNGAIPMDRLDGKMNAKSARINFEELEEWYHEISSCGYSWRNNLGKLQGFTDGDKLDLLKNEKRIENDMAEARVHVQRTFLKATESLLRRPGRPLMLPEDCRFLLILLANPLLSTTSGRKERSATHDLKPPKKPSVLSQQGDMSSKDEKLAIGGATGQHAGIIKRILGLMANLPNECHQTLIVWICRMSEPHFRRIVELVGGFVTYRLTRHPGRKRSQSHDPTAGLIPNISGPGAGTSAHLHAALGIVGPSRKPEGREGLITYTEDWQIKAAAKVMSLLFQANNSGLHHRNYARSSHYEAAQRRAHTHTQLLPTSDFYNTLLDYADLIADFEAWESRRGKFTFCQYPMFLSIWAKIHIMEHDTRRQMEVKAREAFFNSIINRKAISQYLVLKVRRECLVDDSLRGVSEVVGTGQEEIKKGLRIEFMGEEGVDAGGLRKEWFLLLVREVFDPEHGLFVYDEDSHYCYFNPNSFEASDRFFLIGVVIGLAIYNSTILDVALPPFAFRKLLASAPNYTGPATSSSRPAIGYTLDDLEEFRPALAKGLRQLLEYEGNVEEIYCRDFVAEVEHYGQVTRVPLCPNGESRPVTNSNRREFVELYVHYLLDTAVVRQYEPLKRGFFTVCGGNALSLFRPEEIELLVRGSDEPLDIKSLRAVAIHENWKAEQETTVTWFWEIFESANIKFQRRILGFITGSDRIPAMGATSLVIKVACLGNNHERFPIARTCFNMLGLHRYLTKQELQVKFHRAILESEGFGLK